MISPELLKRYPFFGRFSEDQLRQIAMIADEAQAEPGVILFEECQPAQMLYLLLEGNIDLYYRSEEKYHPKGSKEFSVGEISPGEIFGLSALIEPHVMNATARAAKPVKWVQIDAQQLRSLMEKDCQMGFIALQGINKELMERLIYTRVQLAAAWA